jgi:hypothetical protein
VGALATSERPYEGGAGDGWNGALMYPRPLHRVQTRGRSRVAIFPKPSQVGHLIFPGGIFNILPFLPAQNWQTRLLGPVRPSTM